ncbi:MAG: hypothetical protein NVSMB44_34380 [Ktedonobacteraceae bacterium]
MATPKESEEPKPEHPSTYFVQDRSNEEEMNRLSAQDQLFTAGMGGVLPEQPDPRQFRRILDVACGTGGWVLEAAQAYQETSLFGIDISGRMLEYARARAVEQGVADRVEFRVMDALRMLEFPDDYFDLVNMRLSISWMRKWDWPRMLGELQRVTKPGGVVRVTECELLQQASYPALTQCAEMLQCAFFRAGHFFELKVDGLTAHLVPLFNQHGLQQVQTRSYHPEYRVGTPEGQAYIEDWLHGFRTLRPFLQKWGCLPEDYDTIREQALKELQQDDFCGSFHLLTVWGQPASKNR